MPQIIMLSHAAHVNSKRMDEKLGRNQQTPQFSGNYEDSFAENERALSGGMLSESSKKRPYDAAIAAAHDSSKVVGHNPQITQNKSLSDVASDFDVLARYLSDWSV